jgi:hypothetical protein
VKHCEEVFRIFQVAKGVFTNPIILLTVLGVIASFSFSGHLPQILATFLKTLGSAFSATALFLVPIFKILISEEIVFGKMPILYNLGQLGNYS